MNTLLVAINAKYIHSNLAVYSLSAYAKSKKHQVNIKEYTIKNNPGANVGGGTDRVYSIYDDTKKELSEEKDGAVWLAMMELSDYIKFSAIAKNYFNKSSNWILQRLHGYEVNGKPARFKPEEMTVFVRALREISAKLNKCADRLEQAK